MLVRPSLTTLRNFWHVCAFRRSLTTEQAAKVLFATPHTPEAKASVLELCRKALDSWAFSRVEEFAAAGIIDSHTVF